MAISYHTIISISATFHHFRRLRQRLPPASVATSLCGLPLLTPSCCCPWPRCLLLVPSPLPSPAVTCRSWSCALPPPSQCCHLLPFIPTMYANPTLQNRVQLQPVVHSRQLRSALLEDGGAMQHPRQQTTHFRRMVHLRPRCRGACPSFAVWTQTCFSKAACHPIQIGMRQVRHANPQATYPKCAVSTPMKCVRGD
jgi:hypothetical protein